MGKVANFSALEYAESGSGVHRAAITGSEMKQMSAEVIRVAPGARLTATVPAGSDRYLYTLVGEADISAGEKPRRMAQDSFATVQEGVEFTLANNSGGEVTLVSVLSPPPGAPSSHPGFSGKLSVAARESQPVVDIPDQK